MNVVLLNIVSNISFHCGVLLLECTLQPPTLCANSEIRKAETVLSPIINLNSKFSDYNNFPFVIPIAIKVLVVVFSISQP